jgi:hypothetical protein
MIQNVHTDAYKPYPRMCGYDTDVDVGAFLVDLCWYRYCRP